ncbi:MAG: hypothetical protein ACPGSL_02515 [Vicingaceae bacterium]
MKKVLLFAVVLGGLAFTSCSKDEECVLADGSTYETTGGTIISEADQCTLVGGTMK